MDAARTLPFLRGQKSAKNPEDTAKFLEMNNENQNYYIAPLLKRKICIEYEYFRKN